MDDEDQLKVDVAILQTQVKTLQEDTKDLKNSLDSLADVLKDVKSLLDNYRGFVFAILLIGTLMGWVISSTHYIKEFFTGIFSQ